MVQILGRAPKTKTTVIPRIKHHKDLSLVPQDSPRLGILLRERPQRWETPTAYFLNLYFKLWPAEFLRQQWLLRPKTRLRAEAMG
jgi:hypothetical protein